MEMRKLAKLVAQGARERDRRLPPGNSAVLYHPMFNFFLLAALPPITYDGDCRRRLGAVIWIPNGSSNEDFAFWSAPPSESSSQLW